MPVELGTYSSSSDPQRVVYLEELIFTGVHSQWITEAAVFRSAFLIGSSVLTEEQQIALGGEVQSPSGVAMPSYVLSDNNGEWDPMLPGFSFRDMRNLNIHTMCGLPFRIKLLDGSFQPNYRLFVVCKT